VQTIVNFYSHSFHIHAAWVIKNENIKGLPGSLYFRMENKETESMHAFLMSRCLKLSEYADDL